MRQLRWIGMCALALVAVGLTAAFAVQDKAKDAKAVPASAPIDPEMMAKWTAYATPGPEHKVLDSLVGNWTTHVKWWLEPNSPEQSSEGTATIKWIMDHRYLQEEHKGTMMGQPFTGMGITAFDNLKKKYLGSWIDNAGTGIMVSEGTYDPAKKALHFTSESPDPTMTKFVPVRMTSTFVDATTYKMEMWGPDKSGKEFRNMEITYTRSK